MIYALVLALQPPEGLPDPLEAGWEGQPVCEALQETDAVRVLRCTFAPGVGHERHYHAPHVGYVLQGGDQRIVDETGERTVSPKTGGSWTSDAYTVHEVMNVGDVETSYLIIEPKAAAE